MDRTIHGGYIQDSHLHNILKNLIYFLVFTKKIKNNMI